MNEFIHTFSAYTYLSIAHTRTMEQIYGDEFFYNHIARKYIFSKYAGRGFRMEIEFVSSAEKKYSKKHYNYRAEWIVTPAKILYPGQPMKKLYTQEEYDKACECLYDILAEIKKESSIDLLDETKLHRMDIAEDIKASSDEYSQEVIRMAKKALHKYGYNLWSPTEEDIAKTGWDDKNSILFRNHNQEVQTKIYNKLEDMRNNSYDTENLSGLLRFELSLKRKFIRDQEYMTEKYLTTENLPVILGKILHEASDLMQEHIVSPLWSGAMLSKDLQKKYIRIRCKEKKTKYKKMMAYRKECNRKSSMDEVVENPTAERYFREIGLSPLYTKDTVAYMPSFADLLNMTEDEEIKRFVKLHGKN